MAKKRKRQKEEEEVYEFKMPEFDEEEYLRKELRDTKTLYITFAYGVAIAFVSFGFSFFDPAIGALFGFLGIIFLRHIYTLIKVDTSLLEKKQWATNIIFYLFTWLLVWIILTNPPFSDFQEPTIKSDGTYFGSPGNWTRLNAGDDTNFTFDQNISINATIIDNVEVDASSIRISILYDSNVILNSSMENIGRNKYAIFFTVSQPGPHEYKITAKDINGLKTTFHGDFDIP
jgi:hypothetical protein